MRFQTLEQWLEWQSSLNPREIQLGLDRVARVWEQMHSQPFACPVISVAGTNGKGSCVAFLEAILGAAGYRTGCYTSPHLVQYNERIRIDGAALPDQRICQAFERVDRARQGIKLTYFEFGTLAALDIFLDQSPDVVILEVGLGGRLDAVNIIDCDIALITNVDIDHTDWLGETREQIGREKAGIMRPERPAVFGTTDPPESLISQADEKGTPLFVAGRDFSYRLSDGGWDWQSGQLHRYALPIPHLRGSFQLQNASAVLMVLALLQDRLPVDKKALRTGLLEAVVDGRFQVIPGPPSIILDVAHNPQAARALVANLKAMYCSGRTLAIFAMLADKEITEVVRITSPLIDHWCLAELKEGRGLAADMLASRLREAGISSQSISYHENPLDALQAAGAAATEADRLLVFGSFHTVGEVLRQGRSRESLLLY